MAYYHGPNKPSFLRKVKQRLWVPYLSLTVNILLSSVIFGYDNVLGKILNGNSWMFLGLILVPLTTVALMDRAFEDLLETDNRPADGLQLCIYIAANALVFFSIQSSVG